MASVQDMRRLDFDRFRIDIYLPESDDLYPSRLWVEFTMQRQEPILAQFFADDLETIADQFQEMAERLRKVDDDMINETQPVPEQRPETIDE